MTKIATTAARVERLAAKNKTDKRVITGKFRKDYGDDSEKTFTNFQLTKGQLRAFVLELKKRKDNKSAFFRKCIDLYLEAANMPNALEKVNAYMAGLKFKKSRAIKADVRGL